MIDMNLPSSE